MVTEIWVNIGSGNGLLPDGTKPLPDPMLTDHQWGPVTFILGQFHKRCLNNQSLCENPCEKYIYKISFKFPKDQWVIHNQSAGSALDYHLHKCYLFFWCSINNNYSMFFVNGCWVVGNKAKTPLAINTLKADMDRLISVCRWELQQHNFISKLLTKFTGIN